MTAQKKYVPAMPSNVPLYDRDFYAWAHEQAALLRAGRLNDLDIENVAEEIESMGRSEKRELVSRLTVLQVHVLKWKLQQALRSTSWQHTIQEQRRRTIRHLGENPSLKPLLSDIVAIAFEDAASDAKAETGLERRVFPQTCPWTADALLQDGWLPE